MTIKELLEHKWLINKAKSDLVERRKTNNGGADFQLYTTTETKK
jgi:hypothetical protein